MQKVCMLARHNASCVDGACGSLAHASTGMISKKRILSLLTLVQAVSLSYAVSASSGQVPVLVDEMMTRSISKDAANVMGVTAFASHNNFFLGADPTKAVADVNSALARVQLNRVAGVWEVAPVGITPTPVNLNSTPGEVNPFNGAQIDTLALFDKTQPVATRHITTADGNTSKNMVGLVTNVTDGSVILTNATDLINDAAGNDIAPATAAAQIDALAASGTDIFAAVSPTTTPFGSANSGIVRLQKAAGTGELKTVDFDGNQGAAKAYKIDLDAFKSDAPYPADNTKVQFASSADPAANMKSATLGAAVDLHWDDTLGRLYVGLTGATGVASTDAAGAIETLLVGRIDAGTKQFLVQPAVNLKLANTVPLFEADGINNIIGFKNADTALNKASTIKARTMHTSTGKDYVIVNGGVEAVANIDTVKTKVYALPVMPNNGVVADEAVGMLAQKDLDVGKAFQLPTAGGQLPLATDVATKVGSDSALISQNTSQALSDMQVVGDTVYVSVAGTRDKDHNEDAGIFASTAIFDSTGTVRAWTPWQRVMGATDKVAGFGFDETAQDFWYLNGDGNQEVTVTRWNSGDKAAGSVHDGAPLSSALNPTFVTNGDGVLNISDFDGNTSGFLTPVVGYDQLDMMIATGNGQVALIESGTSNDGAPLLVPTQKFIAKKASEGFTDADTTVFVYDGTKAAVDTDLKNLGPITSAELSRAGANKGWVFVGGQNGVAVLSRANAAVTGDKGKGYTNLAVLLGNPVNASDFPSGADWKWVQLKDAAGATAIGANGVRKLVSDGTYLYVLTRDSLQRIEMKAAEFVDGKVPNKNIATLTTLASATTAGKKPTNRFDENADEFFDVMVLDNTLPGAKKVLLATSEGLIVNTADFTAGGAADQKWQRVKEANGKAAFNSAGPVLRLDFVNAKRGGQFDVTNQADGNVYATALDKKHKKLVVYRFDVAKSVVTAIDQTNSKKSVSFYSVGKLSEAVQQNLQFSGPLDFVGQSATYGSDDSSFVDAVPVEPESGVVAAAFAAKQQINLKVPITNSLPIDGVQVRDSASGALYIAGEFGVLVNE